MIEGGEHLMSYITGFYKNLFGQVDSSNISLKNHDMPQILGSVAEKLVELFSMEKLHNVISFFPLGFVSLMTSTRWW